MDFIMRPIGVIKSPFTDKKQVPIQASRSQAEGKVVVDSAYEEGLDDVDGFSHIFLLYAFHRSEGYRMKIQPFLDSQLRGLFSTRYPYRPNPIGISLVELLARQGNELTIAGVDVLDGTPLLDIKPYVPDFDVRSNTRVGWYETRSKD